MRLTTIMPLAHASLANAGWLKWTGDREPVMFHPQPTQPAKVDDNEGWNPRPTPPPGVLSDAEAALALLRRGPKRRATSNTWLDETTCGWYMGVSSSAWTCASGYECATNQDDVVACVSGTYSPFHTVCLDHQAVQQGACSNAGPQTGCCTASAFGECGTFLWEADTPRSMYRCFAKATIIHLNDEPQFVVDASTSITSTATSSSTVTTNTASTSASASATAANGEGGIDSDHDHGHGSVVGPIVGGVVGGVSGIALVAGVAAWLLLRRRRKNKKAGGADYNSVVTSHGPPVTGNHRQPYLSPKMSEAGSNAPTTFPPTSPYPHTERGSTGYDHRGRYHGSTEKSGHGSPGWQHGGYAGYVPSGQPSPQGGLYPPSQAAAGPSPPHSPDPHQHSVAAELESPPAPAGHESNPVELRG